MKETITDIGGHLVAADYLEEAGFYGSAKLLRQSVETWLLRFCEPFVGRFNVATPFVKDGWLYATDSRIIVRIPTNEPDTNDKMRPKVANVVKTFLDPVFDSDRKSGWYQWPARPLEIEINSDEMNGIACPVCHGDGSYFADGDQWGCVYCDGTGLVGVISDMILENGDPVIAGKYWNLVRQLPDVWYTPPMSENSPVVFRFAGGGQGALMPIGKP